MPETRSVIVSRSVCPCSHIKTDRRGLGLAYIATLSLAGQVAGQAQVAAETTPVLETTVALSKVQLPIVDDLGNIFGLLDLFLLLLRNILQSDAAVVSIGSFGLLCNSEVRQVQSNQAHYVCGLLLHLSSFSGLARLLGGSLGGGRFLSHCDEWVSSETGVCGRLIVWYLVRGYGRLEMREVMVMRSTFFLLFLTESWATARSLREQEFCQSKESSFDVKKGQH